MRRYQEYKTSTIRWLDRIPNDWKEERNKNLFLVRKKVVGKTSDQYKVLSLTLKGIIYRDLESNSGKMPKDFNGYQVVLPRSIILCLFDMDVTPRVVGYSPLKGIISSAYTVIVPRNDSVDPQFFAYWFLAMDYNKALLAETKGLRNTIRDNEFLSLKSVCPSIETQKEIVSYLDRTLEKVDYFIKQKQKYIELLKEYKQSKINELVTKGLDPNVKMKDSGIAWLGQIPEHWEKFKLKHIGISQIGITYSPNDVVDEEDGMLVLRSSNIQNGRLSLKDNVYIRKDFKVNDKQVVREGDILICARNGSAELVGKNLLIDKSLEGNTFGAFMTVFRSDYNRYLKYFFNSDFFKSQMGLFSTTTINQLTNSILNNLVIIMPQNKVEIQSLVKEICEIESKFEKLIAQSEKQLRLIKKYRQSLIYELVTGIRKP